ncbi:hypothetical protein RJ640_004523 [Escallonia rubra]|uniref:Uncharacterized protein n=1 Tax=Escallonia rubra TaxID=112253 RepID=A0AA88S6M0_9ASTE|nr:hypothetical protein RJ640_004523 [Escallonia rubra]
MKLSQNLLGTLAYAANVKKRKIRRSKPAAGICSRCGGGARVADMKTSTRFCYVPFYWKSWKAISTLHGTQKLRLFGFFRVFLTSINDRAINAWSSGCQIKLQSASPGIPHRIFLHCPG